MRLLSLRLRQAALLAASTFALAGCEVPEPVEVTQVTRSNSFVTSGLVEMEPTSITTFRITNNESAQTKSTTQRKEVKGVACQLNGRGYSARFTTPAVVLVPEYGQASPLPTVTCKLDGQTVSVKSKLQNRTEVETTGALLDAGGLLGLAMGGAFSAVRKDKDDDNYAYWPIIVEFPEP